MTITATRRRIGIGVAALALAGTGIGSTAYAAGNGSSAAGKAETGVTAKGAGACPKGYLCVWPKKNYKGRMQKVAGNNRDLARFGGAFGSRIYSVYNHGRSCDVKVWAGKNYTGKSRVYKKGTKFVDPDGGVIHSNKWINCR
ncbi:peptidase inhibitor family I36 protein [Streptomyces halobius]|uniref:Peptidase inhibitor family I36 protein n=1 Tax=Streptomyces halobius TaxID=2879846 RepID=A0ABY4M6V6_9ACTN|nr:peptidase inhibitor family I36 protein [Streptomyces halobius]UQA93501.1 peptidase inhibitor family I36 protein [Streptomyces halobius]